MKKTRIKNYLLLLIVSFCVSAIYAQEEQNTTSENQADTLSTNTPANLADSIPPLNNNASDTLLIQTDTLTGDTLGEELSASGVQLTGYPGGKILSGFRTTSIELEKGDIISNLLKVVSNTEEFVMVRVNTVYPDSWRSMTDPDAYYDVYPGDTAFVPIILLPGKMLDPNTNVTINVFIQDQNGEQIGNNYFTINTVKKSFWLLDVIPGDKLYLKNGENEKDFSVNVANLSDFQQEVFLNYNALADGIAIADTNGVAISSATATLELESQTDTTLQYKAVLADNSARNISRISTYNYLPNQNQGYKKYTLFAQARETSSAEQGGLSRGKRIDFIKLPNTDKYIEYGYPALPLQVEAIAQNILDRNSFLLLNMRGQKQFDNDRFLTYFSQLSYNNGYYTDIPFQRTPWYVGYFDSRKSIEIGQISSNIIGIGGVGKGIRGSYRYFEDHKTSAFYVRSPGLIGAPTRETFGLEHTYRPQNGPRITAKAGRSSNLLTNIDTDAVSLQGSYSIARRHNVSLIGALTRSSNKPDLGFLYGGGYNTSFLKNKLNFNLNGRYNNRHFGFGSFERTAINHRTAWNFVEKWNVFLANNYQEIKTFSTSATGQGFDQEYFYNTLVFSTQNKIGSFQPGLFYNFTELNNQRLESRGVTFRFAKFDFPNNFLVSSFMRAGYSRPLDLENENRDFFIYEFSSLVRYRVWNLNVRYNYGILGQALLRQEAVSNVAPQTTRVSLQNQYQFKNKHFVIESNLVYNYANLFKNHSVGTFGEFFYFSDTGWRFSLRANYTFSQTDYSEAFRNDNFGNPNAGGTPEIEGVTSTQGFNLSATIFKEFGIPLPFIKKTTGSLKFSAFYDANGNRLQDTDEPTIENVVVSCGGKQVLTNKYGDAYLENIPLGSHIMAVESLTDLNGWFPEVPDSLIITESGDYPIPFVRGVKVYGDVVLDRQKIAVTDDKPFDLSRIKISATNGKTYSTLTDLEGRFAFYLPNGEYVITLDNTVLTDKYRLTRNNIPVLLENTQGSVYVSFFISEVRRKVKVKDFTPKD